MDIIWTKDELNKIKPIFKKFNLKLNDDYSITESFGNSPDYIIKYLYFNETEDLKKLFFDTSKEDILNTLKLTIGTRYLVARNSNHPIIIGLITTLAKINPNDATEIFTIFIGILSLYKQTSYNYAKILLIV